MDKLRENFCRYLSEWKNKHYDGTQKELGEKFGVSQSVLAKTLSGERWGNESWRRDVAKKIGVKYEVMIGLEDHMLEDRLTPELKKYFDCFKDKKRFLTAVKNLRKLEELDRRTFWKMVLEIEDMVETLKERRQKKQNLSKPLIDIDGNIGNQCINQAEENETNQETAEL